MPYTLNPHRHVKIWLSQDPAIFMNQENQLRLVQMRVKNPDDEIHLVYANTLLAEDARLQLGDFCAKHRIIPVAIEEQVLPRCAHNDEEQRLAEIYQREISALHEGGNVAAASDILRWLSPVYSLGIYSDFDVVIDTSALPPTIDVDAPILLKCGSIKMPIYGLPKGNDLESLVVNNDSVAIVGGESAALKRVQQRLIKAYSTPEIYMDCMGQLFLDISCYVNQQLHDGVTGVAVAAQLLQENAGDFIYLQELAGGLGLVKPDPIALRKAILNKTIDDTIDFTKVAQSRAEMQTQLTSRLLSRPLREKFTKYLAMSDPELIEALENDYAQGLITKSVVHTTGPSAIMLGLFQHSALSAKVIHQDIKPHTFEHYGLTKAFHSNNGLDFHMDQGVAGQKIAVNVGELCDQSWLKEGASLVVKREAVMHHAATNIQRVFKGHQAREAVRPDNARQAEVKASDSRDALFHGAPRPDPADEIPKPDIADPGKGPGN